MTRTLVIGGNLFIGRALLDQLLARGDEVVILHRGQGTPYGGRVGEIRCDRNDISAVRAALAHQPFDLVFDNVYDWARGTTADMVVAAARAAAEAGRLQRYVFTSSVAVYGDGLDRDEQDPLVPADHPAAYYGQKAESERALFRLHRDDGIPVSTIRPSFIYGPNNPFEREAFFWDRILAGRPVIVPEAGQSPMQWVYVRDVARGAVLAAGHAAAGSAYNLAGPVVTQTEYVESLARAAGRSVRTVQVPRERLVSAGGSLMTPPLYFGAFLDIPPITVKTDRARTELGLRFTPLDDGLRETFAWYQQQQRPVPDFAWEDRVIGTA